MTDFAGNRRYNTNDDHYTQPLLEQMPLNNKAERNDTTDEDTYSSSSITPRKSESEIWPIDPEIISPVANPNSQTDSVANTQNGDDPIYILYWEPNIVKFMGSHMLVRLPPPHSNNSLFSIHFFAGSSTKLPNCM